MPLSPIAIYNELKFRRQIVEGLFDKQRKVYEARKKSPVNTVIKTPRRAAKTTLCASLQLEDAQNWPRQHYPYIALTGPSCRQLAWPVFKEIDRKYNLGIKFNDGDLSWWLPNGANGKLWGADREDLQRSLYGGKNRVVVVDECAFWKTSLRNFSREVIEPTVADLRGYLLMVGAPSDILDGFFYELTRPEVELREKGWDCYEWATEDNPYMHAQIEELKKKWEAVDPYYFEKPWYLRQWKGQWIADFTENVYDKYDPIRNGVSSWTRDRSDKNVLAIDTGYSAGMAYVVQSYNSDKWPNHVTRESKWIVQQSLDDIAATINRYRDEYSGLFIVGDPNNAQLIADLGTRYSIPINKAAKTDKKAWIRIINNFYANGICLVVDPDNANADLDHELKNLKKKYLKGTRVTVDDLGNRVIEGPGDWEEDKSSCSNHCTDANLYGFRYCYQYFYREKEVGPRPGTPEYFELEARKMKEQRIAQIKKENSKRKYFH